jgi:peptide deformylase
MRNIVLYPDKILRVKTPEITEVNSELIKEIGELTEVLNSQPFGAGLAAPQIGYPSRFFGLKNNKKVVEIFINPEIVATYGSKVFPMIVTEKSEEEFLEGCLSFPNLWGTVKRYLKIDVTWQTIVGKNLVRLEKTLSGFEAIVFQHEKDHLDGVLFIDLIKQDKGKFYYWGDDDKAKKRADINKVVELEK